MTPQEKKAFSRKGLDAQLPPLDVFPNQFQEYTITLSVPEYTSMCPKTGQPDFAILTLVYIPKKWCVELKSFKLYIHAYRNLGIFYENAANRILHDFFKAAQPRWAYLKAEFTPRGGIDSCIEVERGVKPKSRR